MARTTGGRGALSNTRRVFFALWPDAEVRAALARAVECMHGELHGRPTRSESIHLTLAFLGDVDIANLPRLLHPPHDIAPASFPLILDDWGCWARNGIGWCAPSRVPESLGALAANLENWLRGMGFALERRAFKPHVTLLRKTDCAPMEQAMMPIAWQVNEFVLVRSRVLPRESQYEVIGRWPLKTCDGRQATTNCD
jgi:2'-5' RNA ligase